MITLLSPAKNYDVAVAAIQAGADAIYIGAPRFGARQAASNSTEEIQRTVEYAKQFGVQTLVTLNTLLHADEIETAVKIAWDMYEIGVDALIIQDLQLLKHHLPTIRLHASTQCDNRTADNVKRLRDLGFQRIVLARELTTDEIANIHHSVPDIELEAFVHGALCVSYSGRCYMSEQLLGRSANRGCCAQMCRMRYDLLDKNKNEINDPNGQPIHQRFLLSLQDMDRSAHLKELVEAGITTFKIEGRLKEQDYVSNVTAYYRQQLDNLSPHNQSSTPSVYNYSFIPNPEKTFHRGATNYFLHGRTPNLANWNTPASTGEHIGTIHSINKRNQLTIRLLPNINLHNGDGLCIGQQGFAVNQIHLQNNIATITINKPVDNINIGDKVYRNSDPAFLNSIKSTRRIPVDICLTETEEGYKLQIGERSMLFKADHLSALNANKAEQSIREQLSKLGNTIYTAQSITLNLKQSRFIPISQLNEWRRSVIDKPQQYSQSKTRTNNNRTEQDTKINNDLLETFLQHPSATNQPLMTCRYCILYEMGHCRKQKPLSNEPRYLRLQNGTLLQLVFDCQKCQMLIFEAAK